tara:strand:+ start:73 stop:462 length:390 start_codon:yes stop_codon:yes gene_type:complete
MARRRKYKKKKSKLWSKPSVYKTVDDQQISMDSTWEVVMAMRLDELNIKWERGDNIKLPYFMRSGKKRNYIPDFYLPEYDIYIEVKGYLTESAKHKMKSVLEVNDVKIIMLRSLIEIAEFDKEKIINLN